MKTVTTLKAIKDCVDLNQRPRLLNTPDHKSDLMRYFLSCFTTSNCTIFSKSIKFLPTHIKSFVTVTQRSFTLKELIKMSRFINKLCDWTEVHSRSLASVHI